MSGNVAATKLRFEPHSGTVRKPLIDELAANLERVQPGHAELIEKEKPLIAELMIKLRNRELATQSDYSGDSIPGSTITSYDSFSVQSQDSQPNIEPSKSPKRTRTKSPLEGLLRSGESKEAFRDFLRQKGALENLDFWEACEDCEKKAHGCASLAKKIINQLMKEIKETHGHPEQSHMDLALNSAVIAVRYEIMLHKEETHEIARNIVDTFVRDSAPQRVNLTTEKRNAIIKAVDLDIDNDADHQVIGALIHAQREICSLMEQKYFAEFSNQL